MEHIFEGNAAQNLSSGADARATSPGHQAYQILHLGFTVAPVLAGLDKFFNLLVNWEQYLPPFVHRLTGGHGHELMLAVGVIEILAGLLVALAPRLGGYVVAALLAGIIVNLVLLGDYCDIALRDFGLLVGALALARLATAFPRDPHRLLSS